MDTVLVGFRTDKGMVRKVNEDRLLVRDLSPGHLLAVADGMGGHNAGDVASSLAMEVLTDHTFPQRTLQEVEEVLFKANTTIYQRALQDKDLQGMGTTLTISLITGDRIILGHVGDSRAYLTTECGLKRLTTDHSLVNELIKTNEITEEESHRHPYRHILSQALGTEKEIQVDCQEVEILDLSTLLLCTDGLTNQVKEEEVEEILRQYPAQEAANLLVERANQYGGQDNITVIVCSFNRG